MDRAVETVWSRDRVRDKIEGRESQYVLEALFDYTSGRDFAAGGGDDLIAKYASEAVFAV
jgi:hypothetical protein